MGCGQSKIDNEESVTRCRERRNLMKEVVIVRNVFASAHSGYSVALKDTGAALHDYAEGEVPPPPLENVAPSDPPAVEQPPPPPPPPMESSLPPPPPPLPSFSPMTSTPLQRAVSMPAEITHSEKMKRKMEGIRIEEYDEEEEDEEEEEEEEEEEKEEYRLRKKDVLRKEEGGTSNNLTTPPESRGMAWDYFFMDNIPQPSLDEVEEEEEVEDGYVEDRDKGLGSGFGNVDESVAFMTPKKKGGFEEIEEFKTPEEMPMSGVSEKQFLHSNTAPPAMSRVGLGGGNVVGITSGVDLLKILSEIDDNFLKASQSSQEVSKMLEATKLHYHSNFADNRGHIDHAERVMQVITWNKSFRGAPNGDGAKDNLGADDYDTHATVLDKLLAWEKKLYEEVKAGELMKIEYQRKVAVLNRLKKRNSSSEQLEKAKAAVSHLHTRYIVDMQSLDSTVSEVNDIRDKQLYPKLVALVHGMKNMWESMCMHHDNQLKIVTDIKALDISALLIETSQFHHERTKQLASVVDHWKSQFEKLVSNQKQYIHILYTWLKLNLVPIESSLKEKVSSPPRNSNPPIQPLLATWNDHLDKLPDEMAKSAIVSFSAVIHTIILHQVEEMKAKETYEETRKEYLKKKQGFEDWYQKYMQRRGPQEEMDPDKAADPNVKDPVSERQTVVEGLKKRLDEEVEKHRKLCVQVREKSALNLRIRLPELFRALSNYAHASLDAYERLRWLSQSQLNRGS